MTLQIILTVLSWDARVAAVRAQPAPSCSTAFYCHYRYRTVTVLHIHLHFTYSDLLFPLYASRQAAL